MKKIIAGLCASLALACEGGNNNNNNNGDVGISEVTSDPINGVTASAGFSFVGGIVNNNQDIDQDGADDDSTVTFIAIFTDIETFCDDLNLALLSGDSTVLEEGLGGNAVIVTAVQRVLNASSDLTAGASIVGDGGETDVNVAFGSTDANGTQIAAAESQELGSINLTFDAATTSFSGDFSAILTIDTSGQQAFDTDTDADGVLDATAIDATITGEFANAQICGGVEGLAFLIGLFAGFGG